MTCCIFDTLSVTESNSTSLESFKIWQRAAKKAKLKQHPYSYNGLSKSADLLHKWGFVDSQMVGTVHSLIKSEEKKRDTFKNWPLVKNPHFLSDPHETW